MEPSAELQAVVGRIFDAINARDFPTFRNLQSAEPGALHIGSDPDEWWTDYREAIAVFEVQLREFDTVGVRFETGEIAAYREGTVGWAACRPTVVFGDGSTATVRFTGVLRLEDGIWRVVQSHLSVGATNEETLGYEMTTTIEALADAVQQERPDLAAATAADGTVTIAFSDLEGSTELAVRLGDEKWLDLLRWHDRVVESAVTQENGRVAQIPRRRTHAGVRVCTSSVANRDRDSTVTSRAARRRDPPAPDWAPQRRGSRTRRRSLRSDGHHGGTRCRGGARLRDPCVLAALRTLRNGRPLRIRNAEDDPSQGHPR